jgi:hypothetical protein
MAWGELDLYFVGLGSWLTPELEPFLAIIGNQPSFESKNSKTYFLAPHIHRYLPNLGCV